jgi:hypothetical protein
MESCSSRDMGIDAGSVGALLFHEPAGLDTVVEEGAAQGFVRAVTAVRDRSFVTGFATRFSTSS